MLDLKNITKEYPAGDNPVKALKGVSVSFRRAEFVSVLGPSGCGKTTLLNIIGGLDRYTTGDMQINGVSTKNYKDADFDAYRNHSVGFVFQSYNLIPHQTVIKNVELALTLSGVSKDERRKRAAAALEKVGLGDQLNKKPNQLSGGQMQRVAIARAIVNDPEVILADEPTGALDSETSVQVMEILKELSKTRLVIMVTHNGELAKEYSTRIISLSDGLIVGDTSPFDGKDEPQKTNEKENGKKTGKRGKKPSMSFLTALFLSFNNLITKKARTILTAFAGSIGIIGIALVLSLSAGFNKYVKDVQRDTLSNYPLTITKKTYDYSAALSSLFGTLVSGKKDLPTYPDTQFITSNNIIEEILTNVITTISTNDLSSFREYLEENPIGSEYVTSVRYNYPLNLRVFVDSKSTTGEDTVRRAKPAKLPAFEDVMREYVNAPGINAYKQEYDYFANLISSYTFYSEMVDNGDLIASQYDVLCGSMPKEYNEVVLVLNEYNQLSDISLYLLGLMGDDDITYMFRKLVLRKLHPDWTENELEAQTKADLGFGRSQMTYTFDELMEMEFTVTIKAEEYVKTGEVQKKFGEDFPLWRLTAYEEDLDYIRQGNGVKLKVSGILRQKENSLISPLSPTIYYTSALTQAMIERNNSLEFVKQLLGQLDNEDYFDIETGSRLGMIEDEYKQYCEKYSAVNTSSPSSISIYPRSFEAKETIIEYINNYNAMQTKEKAIKVEDTIGSLLSSVTDIINSITYVLIAFVSISLIVSSIMIAVITHISVLERTKEIGVLRSIGASKTDISNVFNAETFIIGLISGVMGILITLVLIIPINIIIKAISGLVGVAALPVWGALALIGISVLLTVVAGLIPARSASKKDPVVALRSE